MVFKKINKALTLTSLVLSIVLVMALFFGTFYFVTDMSNNIGVPIDSKYASMSANLSNTQVKLDTNVKAIESAAQNITEAENPVKQAWNALIGLGQTLKLPLTLVSTAMETFNILTGNIDILPKWVLLLATIGILATIVFLVIGLLKGEQRT